MTDIYTLLSLVFSVHVLRMLLPRQPSGLPIFIILSSVVRSFAYPVLYSLLKAKWLRYIPTLLLSRFFSCFLGVGHKNCCLDGLLKVVKRNVFYERIMVILISVRVGSD